MAKNDFKPFATGSGANVTSQTDWEALAALSTGFQSGKAASAQVNKAIRQALFIASALAQYTADKSEQDVLDNGDVAGFVAKMQAALGADFQPLDTTLTALAALAGSANKLPYFTGADVLALTNLTQIGRDVVGQTSVANLLTYLGLGTAALRNIGTGANNVPDMNSFASGTGWSRLPNGKILQWGSYSNPGSVFSGTVNFPIPFVSSPGRVLMTSFHTTIDSNPIVLAQDTSNLSLTSFSWRLVTSGPARSFNWGSIGE